MLMRHLQRWSSLTFGNGLRVQPSSALVIVDNGDGMSEAVVRDHWLNPATPVKADRKATSPKTAKNRTIQGEKGIGRFAMFKLGNAATIVTRARGPDTELVVDYDLSFLDEPGTGEAGVAAGIPRRAGTGEAGVAADVP